MVEGLDQQNRASLRTSAASLLFDLHLWSNCRQNLRYLTLHPDLRCSLMDKSGVKTQTLDLPFESTESLHPGDLRDHRKQKESLSLRSCFRLL